MTMGEWGFAALVVSAAAGIARDLIGLRRQRVRRIDLRRLVETAGPGGRIVDRGPDEAIEVQIGEKPGGVPDTEFDDLHRRQDDQHGAARS